MKSKYMHTLDGQPAYFDPKEKQIFFAGLAKHNAVRLVGSVNRIQHDEKTSAETRMAKYGETAMKWKTGWVRVIC